MGLERENTTLNADEILAAIAAGEEIRLSRCRIGGVLDLNRLADDNTGNLQITREGDSRFLTLVQPLYFNACTFEDDVHFAGPWEQADSLKIVFKADVLFNSSVFAGQTRFAGAVFEGNAGFDGCTFCRVCSFQQAVFKQRAMFRTTTFEGYGLFSKVQFCGDMRIANSTFGKGANFAAVQFMHRCDFSGVYARSKAVPVYEGVEFTRKRFGDSESFWRFIKQACQEAGYYQQAGECFYYERCGHFWRVFRGAGYEKISSGKRVLRWLAGLRLLPEFVFGRMLFGYGERPIRVLIAAAVIIFLCGLFYHSAPAQLLSRFETQQASLSFFEGLYFSTITFTTLGLGDIYPEADTLTRTVIMAESLSGVCLMSLFVVCLSKRFSRG